MTTTESPAPSESARGEHTPGPWVAIASIPAEGAECYWIRAAGDFGPMTHGFRVIEVATANGPQWREQAANARLMAASPDMFSALADLLTLHIAHHNHPLHAAARAAIAKAEGRKP